jgi:hypothetical protein
MATQNTSISYLCLSPSVDQSGMGSFADHEPGLWRAVITQALMDAASQSRKSEAKQSRAAALKWLLTDSPDFEAVCDNAGFEPGYVRRRAKEALERGFQWRLPSGQGWRTQGRQSMANPSNMNH